MKTRIVLAVLACLLALPATATADPGQVSAQDVVAADGCYTWTQTLSQGASGNDVTQLQIRVAGWVASGENLVIDGQYGAATTNAVRRFQSGYGLTADGVAGPQTFNKLYELQDDDCTPIHFSYAEFDDNCGANNFEGGQVSAATARENIKRIMWQLEALRHKLGDRALAITSGFRSISCNSSVGGAASSLHMWGQAADLGLSSVPSQCQMFGAAKSAGFEEILGPGYPDHDDHVHVGNKSGQSWNAPNC